MKSPVNKNCKKIMGQKIAAIRRQKGFSQSQLAYDSEIDISTLSRLERGILNVTIDTLIKIADILEVKLKDFLPE